MTGTKRRRATAAVCVTLLACPAMSFTPSSPLLAPMPSIFPGKNSMLDYPHHGSECLPLHVSLNDDEEEEKGGNGVGTTRNARDRIDRKHPKRRRRTAQRRENAVARSRRSRVENLPPSLLDGQLTDDENPDDDMMVQPAANQTPDPQLEDAIDSFLRGEYDRPFSEDAPAPHPGLGPGQAVDDLDTPEPSHGAAVFLRFCAPLSRGDRWGGGDTAGSASAADPWREVLRGAITPTMLARRMRASEFAGLLDWERLDVTGGLSIPTTREQLGLGTTVAFVNAAVFFGDGVEPSMIQFTLRKIGGVWLIDTAVISKKEWFVWDEANL
eukprot:CAMPEP_0113597868 /NCGR_PEP_ID=MMETSP0015_2-20120614/41256_1 /TAXON_ID=2838 /ORGANISM="Odontella" /LENGTH=325 /DNA_ID=CAMNT_0000505793 /DNA_START=93 /DNA_END=1070 /DNA_ORIENTATION=- /assembly_acc=CAM_ASM_000160